MDLIDFIYKQDNSAILNVPDNYNLINVAISIAKSDPTGIKKIIFTNHLDKANQLINENEKDDRNIEIYNFDFNFQNRRSNEKLRKVLFIFDDIEEFNENIKAIKQYEIKLHFIILINNLDDFSEKVTAVNALESRGINYKIFNLKLNCNQKLVKYFKNEHILDKDGEDYYHKNTSLDDYDNSPTLHNYDGFEITQEWVNSQIKNIIDDQQNKLSKLLDNIKKYPYQKQLLYNKNNYDHEIIEYAVKSIKREIFIISYSDEEITANGDNGNKFNLDDEDRINILDNFNKSKNGILLTNGIFKNKLLYDTPIVHIVDDFQIDDIRMIIKSIDKASLSKLSKNLHVYFYVAKFSCNKRITDEHYDFNEAHKDLKIRNNDYNNLVKLRKSYDVEIDQTGFKVK